MKIKNTLLMVSFLGLSSIAFGQRFKLVGSGGWTTVNDSTYSATVTFQDDLTGGGFLPSAITTSFRLFTSTQGVYRVSAVSGATFSTADLTVIEVSPTNGTPSGIVMVYNPDGLNTVPQVPLGATGASSALQAAVDSYNSRQVSSGGGADDQTAAEVPITDSGGFYTGSEVEAALQEVGASINQLGGDSTRLNATGDTLFYYQNGVVVGFGLVGTQPTQVIPDSAFLDKSSPSTSEALNWIRANELVVGKTYTYRPKRIQVNAGKKLIDNNIYTGQVYMVKMPENSSNPGRIVMAYRNASSHTSGGGLKLRDSDDGGKTWQNDRFFITPSAGCHYAAPVLNVIGHDSLFLTYQDLGCDSMYWVLSDDGGATWSSPTGLPNHPDFEGKYGLWVEGHSICNFGAGGEWYVPVFGDTLSTGVGGAGKSGVMRTNDYGASWTYHFYDNASPDQYDENGLVVIGDSLVAFIRMEITNEIRRTASADGINWTTPVDVTPARNYAGKPAPFVTEDGRVLLAGRANNTVLRNRHTYVCESYDKGFTWKNQYIINQEGYYVYGDIIETSPGNFYYAGGVDTLYPNNAYVWETTFQDPDPYSWELSSDTSLIQLSGTTPDRLSDLKTAGNGLSIDRFSRYGLGNPVGLDYGSLRWHTELPGDFDFTLPGSGRLGLGYTVEQLNTPADKAGYKLAVNGKIWAEYLTTSFYAGYNAGKNAVPGSERNTGTGYNNQVGVTTADDNTTYGAGAMPNGNGNRNTADGSGALGSNIEGDDNTATGYRSLFNLNGFWYNNAAHGSRSGNNLLAGSFNALYGTDNSFTATTMSSTASVGVQGFYYNLVSQQAGLGYRHGYYNTTGNGLTPVGYRNMFGNRTGSRNTNEGYEGGFSTSLDDNTGGGYKNLYYNREGKNTAYGSESFNNFVDDVANTKTVSSISGQNWTVTGHGYTVGHLIGFRVSSTGTVPTGIANLSTYIFKVIDANTLDLEDITISGTGSGTITLIPNVQYTNSTGVGYNAEPDSSNQVVLGDGLITQVKAGNYRLKVGQTLGAAQDGYVLTYNHSTTEIEAQANDASVTNELDTLITPDGTRHVSGDTINTPTDFWFTPPNDLTPFGPSVPVAVYFNTSGQVTPASAATATKATYILAEIDGARGRFISHGKLDDTSIDGVRWLGTGGLLTTTEPTSNIQYLGEYANNIFYINIQPDFTNAFSTVSMPIVLDETQDTALIVEDDVTKKQPGVQFASGFEWDKSTNGNSNPYMELTITAANELPTTEEDGAVRVVSNVSGGDIDLSQTGGVGNVGGAATYTVGNGQYALLRYDLGDDDWEVIQLGSNGFTGQPILNGGNPESDGSLSIFGNGTNRSVRIYAQNGDTLQAEFHWAGYTNFYPQSGATAGLRISKGSNSFFAANTADMVTVLGNNETPTLISSMTNTERDAIASPLVGSTIFSVTDSVYYTYTTKWVPQGNAGITEEGTTTVTAEKFKTNLVDVSSGAATVNPPSSPVEGDWFTVVDSRANSSTNNITIDFITAGDNYHGNGASNAVMNGELVLKFKYKNASVGWVTFQ